MRVCRQGTRYVGHREEFARPRRGQNDLPNGYQVQSSPLLSCATVVYKEPLHSHTPDGPRMLADDVNAADRLQSGTRP
jgi:hypothetical protein